MHNFSTYDVMIFDLFHTLTTLKHTQAPGKGTSEILGINAETWNNALVNTSEDRLRGKITDQALIVKSVADQLKPNIPMTTIIEAARSRHIRFAYALQNMPSTTIESLQKLYTAGKTIALISNADISECAGWQHSPVAKFFTTAVFSCDVGFVKPETEIYELCLERLNKKPKDCLYIGDGGNNELITAHQLGMTTVLTTEFITDMWPEKIPELKIHADSVIHSLWQLTT